MMKEVAVARASQTAEDQDRDGSSQVLLLKLADHKLLRTHAPMRRWTHT